MEFQENGTGVKDATAKELNNKVTTTNGSASKHPANSNAEAGKSKTNPAKDEKPNDKSTGQPKTEPAKTEAAKTEEVKTENVPSGIGLERTLKTVHALYRESVKRDNLISRIDELEKFEIQLMEESDELESNHFQGCKLAIYDSKGRTFITNTSNLIKMVAEFVKKACYAKLAEIESGIRFPNA
ncbi:MAG: hypothetical protein ACTHJ8_06395 [Mucilaginibacter sp.]